MSTAHPTSVSGGAGGGEACRLTVVGTRGRSDLALPVSATVGALLPVLVSHVVAPDDTDGPWVLQRLGGEPFDPDGTPESLGLRDGETLYLRSASEALPALHFDDLADGVAITISARPDRWRPAATHRLFLGLACLALAFLAAAVVTAGGRQVALYSGAAALVLLARGTVDARAPGSADGLTPILTGLAACVFAGVAGLSALHGAAGIVSPDRYDVMWGAACAGVAGSAVLVGGHGPQALFGTVLLTSLAAECGAVLTVQMNWDAARASSVVVSFMFPLLLAGPGLSLRLASLRVPLLPRTAEELQRDIDPDPEGRVRARVLAADAYLTVIAFATSLVSAVSFALLVRAGSWAETSLAAVFGVALLLRARVAGGIWQRTPLTFSGALGVGLVALYGPASDGQGAHAALAVALLGAVLLLLTAARRLPSTRLLPVWGHLAEVLDVCTALALLPLLLQVLGMYGYLRGLGG
ncbi:type VII secretion integral membrane protein EccD [Streptomyces sp. NPDC093970]|uniref:type VII secretion integral membrane protein EccD n=1 Tax=Streptomyces sp. NPDC093970 TaxID=3155076 RepID=UPI0034276700